MLRDIEYAIPSLSRAERAVAEWVLAHPRQARDASVARVAAAAGTSEPTVIRFCRRVGATGFRELKLRLAAAVGSSQTAVYTDVTADDTARSAASKVLGSAEHALELLRSRLGRLPLDEAVAALRDARQIVFTGFGASGEVASDARHKFFRLGIPCSTALDSPTLLQAAAIAEPGDVFVAISQSGSWPDMVRGAVLARQRGACVIGVTDPASSIGHNSTLVISTPAGEDTSIYTPMSSRLAQLVILDVLQVALALALGTPAVERLRQCKQALTAQAER